MRRTKPTLENKKRVLLSSDELITIKWTTLQRAEELIEFLLRPWVRRDPQQVKIFLRGAIENAQVALVADRALRR